MAKNTPTPEAPAVAKTADNNAEPANVLVKTTKKQVRIQTPAGSTAIVSGVPNFRITRSQADALVKEGLVTIIEG